MWQKTAGLILRNRVAILVVIGIISVGMGFMATQVKIRYDFAALLPATDSTLINYKAFKQQFGEDGDVLIIGIEQEKLFTPKVYNAWYQLGEDIRNLDGIEQVISSARCYHLVRNDSLKRFDFKLLKEGKATSQAELDSIKQEIIALKFYDKMLWDDATGISVMAITMNAKVLDSKKRVGLTNQIIRIGEKYKDQLGAELRYSGMPYIRSLLAKIVESEMFLFILYALLVTAIIMFVFFRSFKVVMVAMLVVAIGSLWSIGFVSLLGFQLSILTGLVPPLIIVIGVANCIFLLNKYHTEYRLHGNKIKGLQRVVRKVGKATLLTNATTAAGFATFTVVESSVMKEFGIVAAISIMCIFVLSLLLVPIVFSFLKEPKARHVKHLDRTFSQSFISKIVEIVLSYRTRVYWFFGLLVVVGIYGITRITSDGTIVDDFPEGHHVLEDLAFFEKHLNGVVPFEIRIDALKPGKALSPATLKRIDELQLAMAEYPEFSRAVSVAEIVKSLRQSYYGGMPEKYGLPNGSERSFILSYANNGGSGQGADLLNSFIDSAQQVTRVSFQMKDVGSAKL
ncbi:MAG: RND family transporter, partial [Bacteroidetes bacterium]